MQWWCSAQSVPWDWRWQPYPGVWLLVIVTAFVYYQIARVGRDAAGSEERDPWRRAAGISGIVLLWLALDWPVGALGASYLASVHMIQYLLIALAVPPLLLVGLPRSTFRKLGESNVPLKIVKIATHPAPAIVVFVLVTFLTHVPSVVDGLMATQLGSFALDMAWLFSGIAFWWPIVAPVPERKGFPPPLQVLYLFPATLTHTAIAAYLVFNRFPVYGTYELAPPTGWVNAIGDQQIAGSLMWVAATPIMWSVIGVMFFRWVGSVEMPGDIAPPEAHGR